MAYIDKLGSYLARRRFIARLLSLAALGAILLLPIKLLRPGNADLYFAVAFIFGLAAMAAITRAVVRCPQCGASLWLRAPTSATAERYAGACTQCGASFDEPWRK